MGRARNACRNATGISAHALPGPGPEGNAVLFREAQALGSGARSLTGNANASNAAAWAEFQFSPLEAPLYFPENVNSAISLLGSQPWARIELAVKQNPEGDTVN